MTTLSPVRLLIAQITGTVVESAKKYTDETRASKIKQEIRQLQKKLKLTDKSADSRHGWQHLRELSLALKGLEVAPVQEADEGETRHQQLMNKAYAGWKADEEREAMRPPDITDPPPMDLSKAGFLSRLEDPERLAVVFGNLNYQVNNGGFGQWVGNGYKDAALEYLHEYFEKYRGKYPGIEKVARIFEMIDSALEDEETTLAEYDDRKHSGGDFIDKVNEAAGEEDWSKVDELLGGTDMFSSSDPLDDMLQVVRDHIDVSVKPQGDKFVGEVNFNESHRSLVVATTGEFDAEDAAYDAVENLADEWEKSRKGKEALHDRAVEELQNEAEKLANKHAEDRDPFDGADTAFYAGAGDQMLADVEAILNSEFAMAGQGHEFIDDQLAAGADKLMAAQFKAKRAVKDATTRYRAQRQPAAAA